MASMGQQLTSILFDSDHKKVELLIGMASLQARRKLAAGITAAQLLKIQKARPDANSTLSFDNWTMLQQLLFDSGVFVCPTSGSPVFNVASCDNALRSALWRCLCSLAESVNSNDRRKGEKARLLSEFEGAMGELCTRIRARMGK